MKIVRKILLPEIMKWWNTKGCG